MHEEQIRLKADSSDRAWLKTLYARFLFKVAKRAITVTRFGQPDK